MAEGIEVRIYKKGSPGTEGTQQQTSTTATEPGKPSATQKQVNTLLINYGKQTLLEGYKLMTDFTGDYVLANKIDAALNIAADISTIMIGGWAMHRYMPTSAPSPLKLAISWSKMNFLSSSEMSGLFFTVFA